MTVPGKGDMNGARSPRVLLLAMAPGSKHAQVIELAAYFLKEGARVDVVTAHAPGWDGLDERARLHQLHPIEARHPLPWLESTIVIRAPRLAARPLKRLGRPGALLDGARSRASVTVHRRLFMPFYRHLRPLILARLAQRRVLPGIDMAQVVRIVVADRTAVPLGWRLARRHPGIAVTTRMDKRIEEPA
jgi:hypothetical protein